MKEQRGDVVEPGYGNQKKRTFFCRNNVLTINYLLLNMTDLCR